VTIGALGLGPVPPSLTGGRVLMRQPSALFAGAFLTVMFAAMAIAVLAGDHGGNGNAFVDRWVYGAVVVPAAFGIRRYLFRPRIVVDETGVLLDNAFSSCALPWSDIADARGSGYIEVVGTDGDCSRALVYSPQFSSPLTREDKPRALVALIRAESARRAGREPLPEDYAATPLVADDGPSPFTSPEPVIHPRTSYGTAELVAYAVVWTVACIIAAALA
jgi:hypothetical protein